MKISEVALKYSISPDTLRYYEKIGLIEPIIKDESGNRRYSPQDLLRIRFLKCMRSTGLSLKLIHDYLAMDQEDEATYSDRKQILLEQRELLEAKLNDIVNTIDYLDYKIDHYDQKLGKNAC